VEKFYSGKKPEGDEWKLIGSCQSDDMEWQVYRKSQPHDPKWGTYKICAVGKAKKKANYWLARNDTTGQIGFAKDYAIMRDKRPHLHNQVEALLSSQ
jgi:hypothetical protein